MTQSVSLGKKNVGFGKPIYFVAEIGINHNGDINIAKKLIDVAINIGCNAVKFQKRDINLVYSKEILSQKRESSWGTTQKDQKKGLEFGQEEYKEIDKYCKFKKIEWFSSAWAVHRTRYPTWRCWENVMAILPLSSPATALPR